METFYKRPGHSCVSMCFFLNFLNFLSVIKEKSCHVRSVCVFMFSNVRPNVKVSKAQVIQYIKSKNFFHLRLGYLHYYNDKQ